MPPRDRPQCGGDLRHPRDTAASVCTMQDSRRTRRCRTHGKGVSGTRPAVVHARDEGDAIDHAPARVHGGDHSQHAGPAGGTACRAHVPPLCPPFAGVHHPPGEKTSAPADASAGAPERRVQPWARRFVRGLRAPTTMPVVGVPDAERPAPCVRPAPAPARCAPPAPWPRPAPERWPWPRPPCGA